MEIWKEERKGLCTLSYTILNYTILYFPILCIHVVVMWLSEKKRGGDHKKYTPQAENRQKEKQKGR